MRSDKIYRFEDLEVWQTSMKLVVKIYDLLKDSRDFGIRDQIQRSAVSIPSNIAEGYDRKTNKEFVYFLHIAKGSCSELRTQLYLASEIGTIPKESGKELIKTTKSISSMLYSYIQTRQTKF